MRLVTPETVLTILGIQQSAGSLAVAGAALDATFSDLEERTESFLQFCTRTDYFDLDAGEVTNPALRLTSGFVSTAEVNPITIAYSSDGYPLAVDNATPLTSGFVADYIAGVFQLTGTFPSGTRVVSITYSHGFLLSCDSAPAEDQVVPDALVQAHISLASAYMMLNPANIAKEKAKFTAEVSVRGYHRAATRAVERLRRPRALVIWPSHTEVVS